MNWSLRRAERTAHLASAVAWILTLVALGGAAASESNPVSGWFVAELGLRTWAVVTPLLVGVGFVLIRRFGPSEEWRVALGWYLAVPFALDAVGNLIWLAWFGVPSVSWAWLEPAVVGVSVLAVALAFRWELRAVGGSFLTRGAAGKGSKVAAAMAVLLVVTSGLGGISLTQDFSAVQNGSAAGTVLDDFEDGSVTDSWSTGSVEDANPIAGDFSMNITNADSTAVRSVTQDTPNSVQAKLRVDRLGDSIYSRLTIRDADAATTNMLRAGWNTSGNLVYGGDTFTEVDSVTVSEGDVITVRFENIDYSNNQGDVVFYDDAGNELFRKDGVGFDGGDGAHVDELAVTGNAGGMTVDDIEKNADAPSSEYTVSGEVTDADGSAIEGATVSDGNGNSTTTNASGQYSLSLPNGTYTLTASKNGYLDDSQTVTVDGAPVSGVNFTLGNSNPPYVSSADPRGQEYVNTSDHQVSLNATLRDDNGDPIEATIYHNYLNDSGWHNVSYEASLSSGEEINATVTAKPGEQRWKVELSDGRTTQNSSVYKYVTGGRVVVLDGSNFTQIDTQTSYLDVSSTESDFQANRTATNGLINLTDWPNEKTEGVVGAGNYGERGIILESATESKVVVLYQRDGSGTASDPNYVDSDVYVQCFTLRDLSGQFQPSDSFVVVEQFVNGEWQHVESERFGALNQANITLKDGVDYRLKVKNTDGDIRSVGGFTADKSLSDECRPITLYERDDDAAGDEVTAANYQWDAYLDASTNIVWTFNLTNASTAENLTLTIYQRGNQDNEIHNQTFGTLGEGDEVTHTEILNATEKNQTWVVEWSADVNGEAVSGRRVLGSGSEQWPGLPDWVQQFMAVLIVLMTAASVPRADVRAGLVIVTVEGGIFWFIGWLGSDVLSAGAVVLAFGITAFVSAREESEF